MGHCSKGLQCWKQQSWETTLTLSFVLEISSTIKPKAHKSIYRDSAFRLAFTFLETVAFSKH